MTSLLVWHRAYGDRSVRYAECAIGAFRMGTADARTFAAGAMKRWGICAPHKANFGERW